MNEKYIPSKEEIELAEEIAVEDHMTSEQKSDSEFRVKNWEQEQAPWVPFDDDDIDENFERKPATPEQKEDMDRAMSGGAEDFMVKAHFTPGEIIAKIKSVLKKKYF